MLRLDKSLTKVTKLQDKLFVPCEKSIKLHGLAIPRSRQGTYQANRLLGRCKQRDCHHHTLYRLDVFSTGERVRSSIRLSRATETLRFARLPCLRLSCPPSCQPNAVTSCTFRGTRPDEEQALKTQLHELTMPGLPTFHSPSLLP